MPYVGALFLDEICDETLHPIWVFPYRGSGSIRSTITAGSRRDTKQDCR
jgi:hypothetical protein